MAQGSTLFLIRPRYASPRRPRGMVASGGTQTITAEVPEPLAAYLRHRIGADEASESRESDWTHRGK